MVIIEVVSIVIKHPLNPLSPVVKDEFQFSSLNFAQTVRTSSRPENCCPASAAFMWPKNQKSKGAKSGLEGE
jgi:hypothetical protein